MYLQKKLYLQWQETFAAFRDTVAWFSFCGCKQKRRGSGGGWMERDKKKRLCRFLGHKLVVLGKIVFMLIIEGKSSLCSFLK